MQRSLPVAKPIQLLYQAIKTAIAFPSLLTVVLLPIGILSLSGCRPQAKTLKLSTGSPTGYYYRLGEVIQNSVAETVDIDITVQTSEGSIDNLQQLLNKETDIALVQLDVAQASMKAGKVKAIAVLAQEHVHLISHSQNAQADSRQDNLSLQQSLPATPSTTSPVNTLQILQNKTIAVGTPGSGIRFTADQLLNALKLKAPDNITINESGLGEALDLLSKQQIATAFYVGRLGANEQLRAAFAADPNLTLLPLSPSLINFLVTQNPGIYKAATIPKGVYGIYPSIPPNNLTSLTTPTVLVTRPEISAKSIQLLTWSIVATARRYATFYPELQLGDPNLLLRQGLFFIHPEAIEVYEQGDPREAWIRYWENNSDLQAGTFLLAGTSIVGMIIRYWRKQQSQKLLARTNEAIANINQLLTQNPEEALREIEELNQENRLQFIAGKVPDEVYTLVQQKTQTFADQCRSVLNKQHKQLVLNTLLLLDDWQETLQSDPQAALSKLSEIKHQYREMLLANQVDIQAYMELVELTLISVMTLTPNNEGFNSETTQTKEASHRT